MCVFYFRQVDWPLEAHTYFPGVVGEDLVLLAYDACVRAFVDGVGDDDDAVVSQGDVAWMRVLQQLPILIPAAE